MVSKEYLESLIGKKIELVKMPFDPHPIPSGTTGTVRGFYNDSKYYQLWVDWDIKRSLNLVCPPDVWKIKE